MTPIEWIAAIVIAMTIGVTTSTHEEAEAEAWWCFICYRAEVKAIKEHDQEVLGE